MSTQKMLRPKGRASLPWAAHFQTLSTGSACSTATFGGFVSDCQFEGEGLASLTPDATKKLALPTAVGVVAAIVAKVAGLAGAAPILVGGLGALGAFAIVQAMERKGEEKDLGAIPPPIISTVLPPPIAQTPPPHAAPQPFVGPIQSTPTPAASTPGKPWRVLAPISPDGAILSVADIQNALNTLGFATPYLTVDGKTGPATLTALAVKRAQAKYRLPQTGLTTDSNLKIALQNGMNDKAANDKAAAYADALVKSMGTS